jgi:tryptophan synthase alpha chain
VAAVETVLGRARAAGRPILVTYVTGGIRDDWTDLLAAMIDGGADAVEIGLPFSDPMLDGPTIQQASAAAISRGTTTATIFAQLAATETGDVPLIAMAYANHACRRGLGSYCRELANAGFTGTLIPDLPFGEAGEAGGYLDTASAAGLDATLMVAPATPEAQLQAIAAHSRGFLYVMSVMATTGSPGATGGAGVAGGTGEDDDTTRWAIAARALPHSPQPVLIGFGIDTPARAAAAARRADGVVVASALMRRVLDGATSTDIGSAVADLRTAIDAAADAAPADPGDAGRADPPG